MQSLGDRLKAARKRAGMTLAQIGAQLDVSAQAVHQWEKNVSSPAREAVISFARITGSDAGFLFTGIGTKEGLGHSTPFVLTSGGRIVPRLSIAEAVTKHSKNFLDPSSYAAIATDAVAQTYFPCGPKSFQIEITDRSNAPMFEPLDRVTIDPDETPVPGDMVLVSLEHDTVGRIMQFTIQGLDVLNPLWKSTPLPIDDAVRIVGVMTEHARPRRV